MWIHMHCQNLFSLKKKKKKKNRLSPATIFQYLLGALRLNTGDVNAGT